MTVSEICKTFFKVLRMQNKCVIFPEPNKVELRHEEIGSPGSGEILFESLVSLLSTGTETLCLRGVFDAGSHWDNYVKYPFSPGYCMVGRVLEVGKDVTGFKAGERIFAGTKHQKYTVLDTTSQDYPFLKLPEHVSNEEAAWSTLSWITQTAIRRAEHKLGDTAVVIGLGPLGQLITQYLKVAGLREIIAVDMASSRVEIALSCGATQVFAGSAVEAEKFVRECTSGEMADVVYDVTGHYSVLPQAMKLLKEFGALLMVGDCPQASRQHLSHDLIGRKIRIIGSHNNNLPPEYAHWTYSKQALLFMEYLRRGQMDVTKLITHRISPDEAPSMYKKLQVPEERASTLGVIINWQD